MATERNCRNRRGAPMSASTDRSARDDAATVRQNNGHAQGHVALRTKDTSDKSRVTAPAIRPFPLPQVSDRDSYASTAYADIVDRSFHAAMARTTHGLSPAAIGQAYLDWWAHLAFSPGKRTQLAEKAAKKLARFTHHAINCTSTHGVTEPCIVPLPQDRRFDGPAWKQWPYCLFYQGFLLNQ